MRNLARAIVGTSGWSVYSGCLVQLMIDPMPRPNFPEALDNQPEKMVAAGGYSYTQTTDS